LVAVVGLLIILNILCFGLLFVFLIRIRDLSNTQQGFADRIGIIEEMMVELAEVEAEEEAHEEVDDEEPRNPEVVPHEQAVVEQNQERKENFTVEEERTHRILELDRLGLSPEDIAKRSGYSNGEVRLILNLHRSGQSIR
jgi:DNA-directed RNA polymerase specialized sigma24 family protein